MSEFYSNNSSYSSDENRKENAENSEGFEKKNYAESTENTENSENAKSAEKAFEGASGAPSQANTSSQGASSDKQSDASPASSGLNQNGADASQSKTQNEEFTYSYSREGLAEHTGNNSSYGFSPYSSNRTQGNQNYQNYQNYQNNQSAQNGQSYQNAQNTQNNQYRQNTQNNSNGYFANSSYNTQSGQSGYNGYNRSQYTGYTSNGSGAYTNGSSYAGAGYTDYRGYYGENQKAKKKEKKEKNKSNQKSHGAALGVICIILSIIVGLGGSFVFSKYFVDKNSPYLKEGQIDNNSVAGVGDDGTVILYRGVETVKDGDGEMSVADVANLVADSVVEITTEYVTSSNFFFGSYVTGGAGSGVIISTDGYIVTNNHVVTSTSDDSVLADKIQVRLKNGEEYAAEVVGHDADSDIAVIKIDADELTAAVWAASDELVVGQQVIAVGNPLGELGGTVTSGIVSASDREIEIDNRKMSLIQIDAAVNHGNSGGGLFNMNGELVGIVNAKSTGESVEGLGFAIPAKAARPIAEQLITNGYVTGKVYIGVSFYEATSGFSTGNGSESILYVVSTEKGYNDDVLMARDMILAIDGTEVSTIAEIKEILTEHEVGDTLTFSILRGREQMEVDVECFEAPAPTGK